MPMFLQKQNRKRWLWPLLLLCILIVAGAAFFFFKQRQASNSNSQQQSESHQGFGSPSGKHGSFGGTSGAPTPIRAAAASTSEVGVYLSGLGTVTPLHTITVNSLVTGQLMKVLFHEGQMVKQGELLAEIDPRLFQAQLLQAEGALVRDQALLKEARIDLDRYRTLFAQDSIAKQQLDTQDSLVHQYEGTVKTDQGQVDTAKLQLTYSRITAPVAGLVGLRLVDPGNIVQANSSTGLAVVTELQPISVIFTIPQDDLPKVIKPWHAGNQLPVDAYDRAQKVKLATGVLVSIDNQIDQTTGTVKLRAQFDNGDASLFPNQFVNIRMLVDTLHGATVVPVAAVLRGAQGSFVYVVKSDQTVTVRQVSVGPNDDSGQNVTIESGLAPGEQVVVDGTDRLREGAKVEIAGPSDQNATTTPGQHRARDGSQKGTHERRFKKAPPEGVGDSKGGG
jgi:multidrug efflux system membrane fusion protein